MNIKELFLQAVEHHNPEPYLTTWELQDNNETKDNQKFNFHDFKGEEDLKKWIDWCMDNEQPCYLPMEVTDTIEKKSWFNDCSLFKFIEPKYGRTIGISNAIDYIIPRMFKKDIHTVLDFGCGYGRQANLWSDGVYVGMEGVLNSYCCQNIYYQSLGKPLIEMADPGYKTWSLMFENKPSTNLIIHCPTWKYSLLPDNFFDLVICVQVLRELSKELLTAMLKEFHRALKPGGILYQRDHEKWNPCNDLDISKFLLENGFEKATTTDKNWKENIIDGVDMHGTPQVYRKR